MTHGTTIQSADGDTRTFIIIIIIIIHQVLFITHSDNNKLHHNSSSLQPPTNASASLHSHVSKYFYHPHHDINSFTMKLTEYQNTIYVEFFSVNYPAKVTNKRSHAAGGFVYDLIKKYERGEISRLEFVFKVNYRYKKE